MSEDTGVRIGGDTVTQDAVRPARPDGTCFYCREPLGGTHKAECVMRTRAVVVEMTVALIREVPVSWTAEDIEGSLNHSSWCASNVLDDIHEQDGCLCHRAVFNYHSEATPEDMERLGRKKGEPR